MRWAAAIILLLGAIIHASTQQSAGFAPSATAAPAAKLDGLVMQQVPGGYLALSVPPRYIVEFLSMASKLEPHMAMVEVLEHLDRESKKLVPAPHAATVPLGICYLVTDEVLPRHKILDRFVQDVGTYTYLNRQGRPITVQAYAGGPAARY